MPTHIQIGDAAPRVQLTGNGVQTQFNFLFPIFKASDLDVYFDAQSITSGYTVEGVGDSGGGRVVFDVAPAANVIVTLVRRLTIQRLSDFQESGAFRSKVLNDELDFMTAALQQVSDDQLRCAHLAITETAQVDTVLPSPQANTVLVWNDSANGLLNGPTVDEISSAQTNALNAHVSASLAASSQSNAAVSASAAANSAQLAATAAASNMYATNESKTADFSVLPTDDGKQFLIDTSAGSVTVTLPQGATASDGFRIALAKTSADSNAVIVQSVSPETINGGSSWQFSVPHGQSIVTLDTTPAPDMWFAAGVGLVAPIGIAEIQADAKPYDMAFVAGFDSSMAAEPIESQHVYGELVVPRAITLTGEAGYIDVAATGQDVQVDVLINGVSMYAAMPKFVATHNALTPGSLATSAVAAGSRITFKVTTVGSTEPGRGLRFTLKGSLA